MAKPRYKMVRLGELTDGDRFYSFTSGRKLVGPRLSDFISVPRRLWEGVVVYQCKGSTKIKVLGDGVTMYPGKDRIVFVEVDNG